MDNRIKTEITKDDSLQLKGIAILLMLFHHIIGNSYWLKEEMAIKLFSLSGLDVGGWIGAYGKICVGVFAFLTGIAIDKKIECNLSWMTVSRRVFKFLREYWKYCIIFLLLGVICGEPMPDFRTFLYNAFGLECKVFLTGVCLCSICMVCLLLFDSNIYSSTYRQIFA